jgi:hypothetical protein
LYDRYDRYDIHGWYTLGITVTVTIACSQRLTRINRITPIRTVSIPLPLPVRLLFIPLVIPLLAIGRSEHGKGHRSGHPVEWVGSESGSG